MSTSIAFVAGATGYTGRAVVERLVSRGVRTVAHVRPDSPHREEWSRRWTSQGAQVDATPWELDALTETLRRIEATHVFALLGTTRRRAKQEGRGAIDAYETIDYGLTMMLRDACVAGGLRPRFVYLSAAGLREDTRNPYMAVRVRVERALRDGDLPYTIARPSIITGDGRDESRTLERAAAGVFDAALGVAGLLGARTMRDRYRSTDNVELAEGLVRVALDPAFEGSVVHTEQLRS